MILINQILNLFDIKLNQDFYAFCERGTTHLCRISEKGLHEKVDNDWALNNDILAELIFGHYAVKPITEGGKQLMYVIGTNKAHDIILIHTVKTKDEGIRYMEHIHRAYQLAVENKENITKLTDAGFDVQDVIYVRLAGDVVC